MGLLRELPACAGHAAPAAGGGAGRSERLAGILVLAGGDLGVDEAFNSAVRETLRVWSVDMRERIQ